MAFHVNVVLRASQDGTKENVAVDQLGAADDVFLSRVLTGLKPAVQDLDKVIHAKVRGLQWPTLLECNCTKRLLCGNMMLLRLHDARRVLSFILSCPPCTKERRTGFPRWQQRSGSHLATDARSFSWHKSSELPMSDPKISDGPNERAVSTSIPGTGSGIPDEALAPGDVLPEPPTDEEVARIAKLLKAPVPEARGYATDEA